jgi:hypothetical protein
VASICAAVCEHALAAALVVHHLVRRVVVPRRHPEGDALEVEGQAAALAFWLDRRGIHIRV